MIGVMPLVAALLVEVEDAVHVAVVGDGERRLAVRHRRGHDLADSRRAVEHRVLGMSVQVDERRAAVSCALRRLGQPLPTLCPQTRSTACGRTTRAVISPRRTIARAMRCRHRVRSVTDAARHGCIAAWAEAQAVVRRRRSSSDSSTVCSPSHCPHPSTCRQDRIRRVPELLRTTTNASDPSASSKRSYGRQSVAAMAGSMSRPLRTLRNRRAATSKTQVL